MEASMPSTIDNVKIDSVVLQKTLNLVSNRFDYYTDVPVSHDD